VVTIGVFDGVHRGHQQTLDHAVRRARALGVPAVVMTFDPHPSEVVRPGSHPAVLTEPGRKAELLAGLGVDALCVVPFTPEFSRVPAEGFVHDVLVDTLHASLVVVGENFRFGHKAAGDVALLRAQDAFETRVARLLEVEGEIASSTHIRGLLLAGEVDVAARFLGDPFELRGIVAHGDKRGRELGYPTANLVPDDAHVCPGHGVYACRAGVLEDGKWVWRTAATNVGVRPTFVTGRGLLVEAFVLDFSGDIYGKELRLQFLERLRGEKRFETVEALVEQMDRDIERTRSRVPGDV
jgi:riboflavin kinase/FMN adenylyltransferase